MAKARLTSTKQFDPTHTVTLRRAHVADMLRRFRSLEADVYDAVVTMDVFGLSGGTALGPPVQNVDWQSFRFATDAQKLAGFQSWFKGQVDAGLLTVEGITGDPWTAKYVNSAYRKGVLRAYTDTHRAGLLAAAGFYAGSKAEFLRAAFSRPERVSKLRLLYTRSYEELSGISAATAQTVGRVLAQGIADGKGARVLAKELQGAVQGMSRTRASTLARTEIIHAHAEGQLDGFEEMGVDEIGIQAEWLTAQDDRVCATCAELEGQLFSVDEARGLLPRHPNCRCAWIPYLADTPEQTQIVPRQVPRRVDKSGALGRVAGVAVVRTALKRSKVVTRDSEDLIG